MAIGNNAASVAAQVEAMRPEVPALMLLSSVLWGRIEARTDMTPVGSRPTRVPTQPIVGGLPSVFGPDGTDMGLGSGPQEVPGYLSCAYYLQASQYTAQAEWSTDSTAKAVQDYVALTHEQAAKTFGGFMDTLAQGDGSNTLDTIVSVVSGGLTVNNANFFQSNWIVDIFTAVGGTYVTTLQIEDEDVQGNTIWMTTPIPAAVTAGMIIVAHGASAQANTGLFGLKYWQVGSNVGNFMGIQRASYPGRYTAANTNLGGASLTPASVRAVQVQVFLNMGKEVAEAQEPVAHCNVDQQVAWENNALPVQSIDMAQLRGDQSVDMLKRDMSGNIAGRPFLVNPRATPGRLDFIDLKNFWRIETKATDYYDVGGQTIFPAIGASGGIQSSNLFYLVVGTNMGETNARIGAFISNSAIPKGLFGK